MLKGGQTEADGKEAASPGAAARIWTSVNQHPFIGAVLPSLKPFSGACSRILARWPDIIPETPEKDRERLVQEIAYCLRQNAWADVPMSKVTAAARIAFDLDFRQRTDLEDFRTFVAEESAVSTRSTFVSAVMQIYLESYNPEAQHTKALSTALSGNAMLQTGKWAPLVRRCPQILQPPQAHSAIAEIMAEMIQPFQELRSLGFPNPHGGGLTEHAHREFLVELKPQLVSWSGVERLLDWIKPKGQTAKTSGASAVIEAFLSPWLKKECPEDLREHLTESLLDIYGDPRLSGSSRWHDVAPQIKDLMLRWLTKADMRFFIEVVDETQNNHMWPPRRDFWMKLYDQGRIDSAWVAFCETAADYAELNLMGERKVHAKSRFGRQTARGSRIDTSLLIMKIGSKIVVDGCHSYKTHIFNANNPDTPKLFQQEYNCEHIRTKSSRSQKHWPIEHWQNWVEENT